MNHSEFPHPEFLTREQVRSVDARAIAEYDLPGIVLMENAGRGCVEFLLATGDLRGPVVICAGKGNNAGDGFVMARHLDNLQIPVKVLLLALPESYRGDAAINLRVIEKAGLPIACLADMAEAALRERLQTEFTDAQWIVDGLLGTGIQGEVREPFCTVIEAINASSARVFAVDLPSGMDCDRGEPLGCCVRADRTATFVARKAGFRLPAAVVWTGEVAVVDIGVPRAVLETI